MTDPGAINAIWLFLVTFAPMIIMDAALRLESFLRARRPSTKPAPAFPVFLEQWARQIDKRDHSPR